MNILKKDLENSEDLQIYKVNNNGQQRPSTRDKRSLSTIDMEPQMMRRVVREVTDFFHPKTRELYQASGRPYRHGFLLSGPPDTGKTSLSVAIASHAGVPLVIFDLQDMDDKDLEQAFENLPIPCVVLLEDVDASAADVSERLREQQVDPTKIRSRRKPPRKRRPMTPSNLA